MFADASRTRLLQVGIDYTPGSLFKGTKWLFANGMDDSGAIPLVIVPFEQPSCTLANILCRQVPIEAVETVACCCATKGGDLEIPSGCKVPLKDIRFLVNLQEIDYEVHLPLCPTKEGAFVGIFCNLKFRIVDPVTFVSNFSNVSHFDRLLAMTVEKLVCRAIRLEFTLPQIVQTIEKECVQTTEALKEHIVNALERRFRSLAGVIVNDCSLEWITNSWDRDTVRTVYETCGPTKREDSSLAIVPRLTHAIVKSITQVDELNCQDELRRLNSSVYGIGDSVNSAALVVGVSSKLSPVFRTLRVPFGYHAVLHKSGKTLSDGPNEDGSYPSGYYKVKPFSDILYLVRAPANFVLSVHVRDRKSKDDMLADVEVLVVCSLDKARKDFVSEMGPDGLNQEIGSFAEEVVGDVVGKLAYAELQDAVALDLLTNASQTAGSRFGNYGISIKIFEIINVRVSVALAMDLHDKAVWQIHGRNSPEEQVQTLEAPEVQAGASKVGEDPEGRWLRLNLDAATGLLSGVLDPRPQIASGPSYTQVD